MERRRVFMQEMLNRMVSACGLGVRTRMTPLTIKIGSAGLTAGERSYR
jgi:hypothetical protein